MSTLISLSASKREAVGKGNARSLRKGGLVPAIIYGFGKQEVRIALSNKDLSYHYNRGGFMSSLVNINVGDEKYRVLPKDIQLHPVTDKVLHADFVHISEHQKIKVVVNIDFINKDKSIGLKKGGILNVSKHDVELFCDAEEIPHHIEVDVEFLDIGQNIHAKDLNLPKDVELAIDPAIDIAAIISKGGAVENDEVETTTAANVK